MFSESKLTHFQDITLPLSMYQIHYFKISSVWKNNFNYMAYLPMGKNHYEDTQNPVKKNTERE